MRFKRSSLGFASMLSAAASLLIVAACTGGNSQGSPSGVVPSASARHALYVSHRGSWMASDAKTKDLLYVSDSGNNDVVVYSYPDGNLEGTLTGFNDPLGECVDNAGDVFITTFNGGVIYEFSHGATWPKKILYDPEGLPVGCTVNPATQNLAVVDIYGYASNPSTVELYTPGYKKKPTTYINSATTSQYFDTYDGSGNLFVDGYVPESSNIAFALWELANGSSTFKNITLNKFIASPAGVQWDGKYVAVLAPAHFSSAVIYQFTISGSSGTVEGSTPLNVGNAIGQIWIAGDTVIAAAGSQVFFWPYPAGGNPTTTINGFSDAQGVVVSGAR
jgi:hypothetical protein